MTAVDNQQQQQQPSPYPPRPDDIYDPDDVGFPRSPPLQPLKVNLRPSPTPPFMVPIPPSPIQFHTPSPPSGASRRKDGSRIKLTGNQSDAGLVSFMAGGMAPEVARQAGKEPFAAPPDNDEPTMNGNNHVEVNMDTGEEEEVDGDGEGEGEGEVDAAEQVRAGRERDAIEKDGLALVAAQAFDALEKAKGASPPQRTMTAQPASPLLNRSRMNGEAVGQTIPPIPPVRPAYLDGSPLSPEAAAQLDARGGLPPIRQPSSNSSLLNGSEGPITLPSISVHLGDFKKLQDSPAAAESPFAASPPSRPPPLFSSHGSPPKSPNDTFRRELPSPGRPAFYNYNAPRRPSQVDAAHYSSTDTYSSAGGETPSTDQSGVTPAVDRMSIDEITNPQIGGYQCTYPGCTAPLFQTQYLLNSHANVHSTSRPHYCQVKGCGRAEGGKGFKRKNEMIRHGLVHESPGYVCPFCPDKEHKYPRPDNLQRHVRVHHKDRDKDDQQLRDILAQRPEGPNRGRRRRTGNS